MSLKSKSILVSVTHSIYGGSETEDIKINKKQFDDLIMKPHHERSPIENELLAHIHEEKGLPTKLLSHGVKSQLDKVNKDERESKGTEFEEIFSLYDKRESMPWDERLKTYFGLNKRPKTTDDSEEYELLLYMQDRLKSEYASPKVIANLNKNILTKLLVGKKTNKIIQLKRNERSILELRNIEYLEERSTGIEGGHAGVSYKVSKNVTLRTGRFKGTSTRARTLIDKGQLIITSLRIVFSGNNYVKEIPYTNILTLEVKRDDIVISIKGKQKKETYRGFLSFDPIIVNIPKAKGNTKEFPPHKWFLTGVKLKSIIGKLRSEIPYRSESESKIEDSFIIELIACGPQKAKVITAIRDPLDLGLREAVEIVSSAPVDLQGTMTKVEAEILKQALEELGATVNMK